MSTLNGVNGHRPQRSTIVRDGWRFSGWMAFFGSKRPVLR